MVNILLSLHSYGEIKHGPITANYVNCLSAKNSGRIRMIFTYFYKNQFMAEGPGWITRFVNQIFRYRYTICMIIIVSIILSGFYLHNCRNWIFKDVVQVCSSSFIVLTLFFAAMNYEFTANKTRMDNKSAKEILTYNIAAEWHKAPIKDYQKTIIQFENKFIKDYPDKTIEGFQSFIEEEGNLEYKESLKGILNYFESVSIAAYKGVIDRVFIKDFHRSIYVSYYIDYYLFIRKRRQDKDNDAIWGNFTTLAEEWNPSIRDQIEKGEVKSTVIV